MIDYILIRSKRKTISLSINNDLNVIVRAPLRVSKRDIEAFINKHSLWIDKNKLIMKEQNEKQAGNILSDDKIAELKIMAKEVLPLKVMYYKDIMNVSPTGTKITSAITRWGSCSGKNNLCFSYRLMLLPDDIIDYIVVHELAHIRVKNHSSKFYLEVMKYMPDYKERVYRLKQIQKELPR